LPGRLAPAAMDGEERWSCDCDHRWVWC
jgi:hypothetical protein